MYIPVTPNKNICVCVPNSRMTLPPSNTGFCLTFSKYKILVKRLKAARSRLETKYLQKFYIE